MPWHEATTAHVDVTRSRTVTSSIGQCDDGGAEVCARVIVEGADQRMCAQDLVHTGALHADAAAVNEAHQPKSGGVCFLEIGIDHVGNVAWRERMEIELRPDRYDMRVIH